jgi:SAM-dependent methyltransferase
MSDLTLAELEETAVAYEERLVPALFQRFANRMADIAEARSGDRVLDVACGTGVLARTMAPHVGPNGAVAGVDANPGMLAVAARIAPAIEWRQSPAESLPYPDDSFDVVVSQFGLMFFTDQPAGLRQMMRVLAPEGRLAVAVFDSPANIRPYELMAGLLEEHVGPHAAGALRFPFTLGDVPALRALFAEAGIDSPRVTTVTEKARFSSVREMVLADVKGWFPLAQIVLDEQQLERLVADAERALRPYVGAGGNVEFDVPAHIVSATKG